MSLTMRLIAARMRRNRHSAWSSALAIQEYMTHPHPSTPVPHEFYQVNHVIQEAISVPGSAPRSVPGSAPRSVPGSVPGSSPHSIPAGLSQGTPTDTGSETPTGAFAETTGSTETTGTTGTTGSTHEFTVHSVVPATDAPRDTPLDICIYVHGGGYLEGLSGKHWRFISSLAAAGMKVIVPDYGLAPEFEATRARDLLTIIHARASREAAASGHRVRLAGDSAGAGLALGWLLTGDATGPTPIDRIALLSPWLDITCSAPGIDTLIDSDPLLRPDALRTAGESWARAVGVHNPLVNPLNATDAQLASLPPIAVWTGTRDILHADAIALENRLHHLRSAGASDAAHDPQTSGEIARTSAKPENPNPIDHQFHTCPGAVHNYPLTSTPEGRQARHEVIDWLSQI